MRTAVVIEHERRSETMKLDGNAAAIARSIAHNCEQANRHEMQRIEFHFSDSEVLVKFVPRSEDGKRERRSS